jgi:CheY-like chemotaxis protein
MKKTVLLVDDTVTVRSLERLVLGDTYVCVEAENGKLAVEMARDRLPDLILMDYLMPVMDGLSALQALKADKATRGIPVVMITTRTEEEVRGRATTLGCAGFLAKPLSPATLRECVTKLIGTGK